MKPIVAPSLRPCSLALPMARAQDTPKPAAAPQAAAEPNLPGLGEIMSLQQMRHIKLWFAGHAGNWPLADYEIGELKEGFDDVNKLLGGDIVDQHVGAPLSALRKGDRWQGPRRIRRRLRQAQRRLQRLPSCARSRLHRDPASDLLPYSNQSFSAQK